MDEITTRQSDDWHAHLRENNLMANIISLFNIYGRVVCMGNLTESVDSLKKIISYLNAIKSLADFFPIIGVVLTKNSTVGKWAKIDLFFHGKVFIKYLPEGVTTNSEMGIAWPELKNFYPILRLAEEKKIPVLIHAEIDKDLLIGAPIPEIDREEAAIPLIEELAWTFPGLIINIEHVSTRAMLKLIKAYKNLSGSVSLNHLSHRYEDVFDDQGRIINVHKYFKPVAKKADDQNALIETVLSGHPKFFFGSDSAPHIRESKEQFKKAGAFNALTNLAWLCEFFKDHGAKDKFEPFVSEYGAKRYGFPLNEGAIKLRRQDWQVPLSYRGIVPDLAGRIMKWKIVE